MQLADSVGIGMAHFVLKCNKEDYLSLSLWCSKHDPWSAHFFSMLRIHQVWVFMATIRQLPETLTDSKGTAIEAR